MHRVSFLFFPVFALACTEKLDPSIPDAPDDGLEADPSCESFTDSDGETFEIEGATRYLVVDFDIGNDDKVSGTLQLLYFANQEWKDFGEDDCQIQWSGSGKISEDTQSCGACDANLSISFAIDTTNTNCPVGLYEGYEQFEDSYDVLYQEDNDATIYFGSTGNPFMNNAWFTSKRIWGHTDPACAWFGSSE